MTSHTGANSYEDYLQVPNSAVAALVIERDYLRNHSVVVKAKEETESALVRERTTNLQLKLHLKQQKTLTDILQSQIEILQTEKTKLQSVKTAFGKTL